MKKLNKNCLINIRKNLIWILWSLIPLSWNIIQEILRVLMRIKIFFRQIAYFFRHHHRAHLQKSASTLIDVKFFSFPLPLDRRNKNKLETTSERPLIASGKLMFINHSKNISRSQSQWIIYRECMRAHSLGELMSQFSLELNFKLN